MRDYWSKHARRAPVDRNEDPYALGSVCHPGQELAFNRYYALAQRAVFERLFDLGPGKEAPGAALDVDCGGGRWCELFADRGYDAVEIDRQAELIEQHRVLYPGIEFVCSSLQEYRPDREFDVVSSVTAAWLIRSSCSGA
jgi:trans-aconitate methyltransferase